MVPKNPSTACACDGLYYYFGPKDAKKLGLDHEADKDKIIMLYIAKWYLMADDESPCGPYLAGDYQKKF